MRCRKKTAFTLVELLVVIGIIAVLMAILLPSLRKARQAAITTACLSNLRQIGMAFNMYVNENHGWLPSAGPNHDFRLTVTSISLTWPERLVLARCIPESLPKGWNWTDPQGSHQYPISGRREGVFVCPGWGSGSDEGGDDRPNSRGYGMLGTNGLCQDKTVAGILQAPYVKIQRLPKDRIILFDGYQVVTGAANAKYMATNTGPFTNSEGTLVNNPGKSQYGVYLRHNGAANYLLSDWHAERNDSFHKTGYATPGNKWLIETPTIISGVYNWKILSFAFEITSGVQ